MKFTLALSMIEPTYYLDVARTAETYGWDTITVPDNLMFPEQVSADYPYSEDGQRFWPPDSKWLDPFVAIPMMAAVTSKITFYTNVLKLPIREPLLVAKAVGSIAVMSNNRLALGVGLSWMPEEFKYLHQDMKSRGARVDEMIEIIRGVLLGGMFEYHGKYYDFDRLQMSPAPDKPVPMYIGGISEPALRRAARLGDGWIAVGKSAEETKQQIAKLHKFRKEYGR